jgi:hypothetical protein
LTSLLIALAALVAATAATAAPAAKPAQREFGHALGKASAAQLPSELRRVVRSAAARKVDRKAVVSAALAEGEFAGFGYCADGEVFIWPADAPSHQATITRTHVVSSASGDFTDAQVSSSPFFLIQQGPDYLLFDTTIPDLFGPFSFPDAWISLGFPAENTDTILIVNEVTTVDNDTAAPAEFDVLPVLGPTATSPITCVP